MDFLLPKEFNYNYICENGRALHFTCTNEALPLLVKGHLACEDAAAPAYREIRKRYSLQYLEQCLNIADENAVKYKETGGMHFSSIFDSCGLLSFFEDIGRHNSVDKVVGDCLENGRMTEDGILLISGRISSEIIKKAGVLGVSVVASQAKAMLGAYELAKNANITLIGYLGKQNIQVYCAGERLV